MPSGVTNTLPGVRVRVEQAGDEALVEERAEVALHERRAVDVPRAELRQAVDVHAVDEAERDDAAARGRPVHLGHEHAELLEVLADLLGRLAFEHEVELAPQRLLGLAQDDAEVHLAKQEAHRAEQEPHEREVDRDAALEARVQHLDDDLLAGLEPRHVDLRHRRGRDRRLVELGEDLVRRRAELRGDDGSDGGVRRRLDRVAERAELLDVLGRQQVRLHRRELTDLDVRALEPARRLLEAPRVPAVQRREALGAERRAKDRRADVQPKVRRHEPRLQPYEREDVGEGGGDGHRVRDRSARGS